MNARTGSGAGLFSSLLLLALALLLALVPQFARFPEPRADLVLDQARFVLDGGAEETVALPHSWPRSAPFGSARAEYVIEFDLAQPLPEPVYLIVRAARQHLVATLNDQQLPQISSEPWLDPAAGAARRLRIPDGALLAGENRLVVTLAREYGAVPGYLSRLFIGGERMVALDHWSRAFGSERVRAAAHGLHLVIVIGLATLWSARRRDPAFGWLFLIGVTSFVVALPSESNLPAPLGVIKPYLVLTLPAFGLMAIGLGLAIAGTPTPRWLRLAIPGVPAVLMAFAASGVAPPFASAAFSGILAIGTQLAAAVVVARAYLWQVRWEVGVLAIPFFLTGW